jgi:hypothetical protein
MIGLLDFLGSKIDELTSTTDIEELVQEVVLYLFVSLAVAHWMSSHSSCSI